MGILINLTSDYTKPLVDKLLSKVSSKWRNRSERKRKEYEQKIQRLMFNKEIQNDLYQSIVRLRFEGIQFLLLGIVLFIVFDKIPANSGVIWIDTMISLSKAIIPILGVFLGIKNGVIAVNDETLLLKSRIREKEKETEDLQDEIKKIKAETKQLKIEAEAIKEETSKLKTAQ